MVVFNEWVQWSRHVQGSEYLERDILNFEAGGGGAINLDLLSSIDQQPWKVI